MKLTSKEMRKLPARILIIAFAFAAIAILSGIVLAQRVAAAIITPPIEPTALLKANGQQVQVSGPLACSSGDTVDIRVVVTQPATTACAKGHYQGTCTAQTKKWTVTATTHGPNTLAAGPAQVRVWSGPAEVGVLRQQRAWRRVVTLVEQ